MKAGRACDRDMPEAPCEHVTPASSPQTPSPRRLHWSRSHSSCLPTPASSGLRPSPLVPAICVFARLMRLLLVAHRGSAKSHPDKLSGCKKNEWNRHESTLHYGLAQRNHLARVVRYCVDSEADGVNGVGTQEGGWFFGLY